jgi:hypothetical protein
MSWPAPPAAGLIYSLGLPPALSTERSGDPLRLLGKPSGEVLEECGLGGIC